MENENGGLAGEVEALKKAVAELTAKVEALSKSSGGVDNSRLVNVEKKIFGKSFEAAPAE